MCFQYATFFLFIGYYIVDSPAVAEMAVLTQGHAQATAESFHVAFFHVG